MREYSSPVSIAAGTLCPKQNAGREDFALLIRRAHVGGSSAEPRRDIPEKAAAHGEAGGRLQVFERCSEVEVDAGSDHDVVLNVAT